MLKDVNVDVKAVKPGIVPVILEDVRAHVGRDKLVVSIAAAVSINNIQSRLEEKSKVKINGEGSSARNSSARKICSTPKSRLLDTVRADVKKMKTA